MKIPGYKNIIEAHQKIAGFINKTPILTSSSINQMFKCELFFKCENFQKVGAFKYRGATNAVQSLNSSQIKKGVATHSSGNHAQALSLAAKVKGTKAFIVMPNNSKKVKIDAVKGYGAEIIFCEPTLKSREDTLDDVVKETGAYFIHPYNNYNIICGQGTASLELLDEISNLDIVIAPVGGGGLISGTVIGTKGMNMEIKVIGAEPKNADDAYRSFKSGELVPSVAPNTIADGLLTSLGDLNFEIIKSYLDDIYTVSEENIIKALRLIWERMKIVVEPSAAVTLAAIIEHNTYFTDKKVGLILSGGNVDINHLPFN